jgi:hypothetical protein
MERPDSVNIAPTSIRPSQLSLVQEAWLAEHQAGMAVANFVAVVRLQGPWKEGEIDAALRSLAQRHVGLATCYPEQNGVRIPRPLDGEPIGVSRLAGLIDPADDAAMSNMIRTLGARDTRLASAPPIAAHIAQVSEAESLLILVVHPLATDRISQRILFRDLVLFLFAASAGRSVSPAPLARQYADFAAWQQEQARIGVPTATDVALVRSIAESPRFELPADSDLAHGAACGGSAATEVRLDRALAAELVRRSELERMPLLVLGCAAFCVLLARWSSHEEVCFRIPIQARTEPGFEQLIGTFADTAVLHVLVSPSLSLRALMWSVRALVREVESRAISPASVLLKRYPALVSKMPRVSFECSFAPGAAKQVAAEPDRPASPLRLTNGDRTLSLYAIDEQVIAGAGAERPACDVTMQLRQVSAGLVLRVEYDVRRFNASTISQHAMRMIEILGCVASSPTRNIGSL